MRGFIGLNNIGDDRGRMFFVEERIILPHTFSRSILGNLFSGVNRMFFAKHMVLFSFFGDRHIVSPFITKRHSFSTSITDGHFFPKFSKGSAGNSRSLEFC